MDWKQQAHNSHLEGGLECVRDPPLVVVAPNLWNANNRTRNRANLDHHRCFLEKGKIDLIFFMHSPPTGHHADCATTIFRTELIVGWVGLCLVCLLSLHSPAFRQEHRPNAHANDDPESQQNAPHRKQLNAVHLELLSTIVSHSTTEHFANLIEMHNISNSIPIKIALRILWPPPMLRKSRWQGLPR